MFRRVEMCSPDGYLENGHPSLDEYESCEMAGKFRHKKTAWYGKVISFS